MVLETPFRGLRAGSLRRARDEASGCGLEDRGVSRCGRVGLGRTVWSVPPGGRLRRHGSGRGGGLKGVAAVAPEAPEYLVVTGLVTAILRGESADERVSDELAVQVGD